MKNKKAHLKIATLSRDGNKSAMGKLAAFCSASSLVKSDEELRDSFESFFVNYQGSENVVREEHLSDFKAIEKILPVLYDLGEQLDASKFQHDESETSQADPGNRLYASLKRHPE